MGGSPKAPPPKRMPDPEDPGLKRRTERKRASKRKKGREGTMISSIMGGDKLG